MGMVANPKVVYSWDFLEFGIGCVVGVVENNGHAHRNVTSTSSVVGIIRI